MVTLSTLWLPILVATVLVYFASFVMWMVLPHHRSDWLKLPDEDEFLKSLTAKGLNEGQFAFPHARSPDEMKTPAYEEKKRAYPSGYLFILGPNRTSMTRSLILNFVHYLIITILVAYLAGRTLPLGAEYLDVFRVAGTAAILGYAGSLPASAIWFGHSWSSTGKQIFDGVVYGLLTAGVFGWLWPV